jgi:hypothetical protein
MQLFVILLKFTEVLLIISIHIVHERASIRYASRSVIHFCFLRRKKAKSNTFGPATAFSQMPEAPCDDQT